MSEHGQPTAEELNGEARREPGLIPDSPEEAKPEAAQDAAAETATESAEETVQAADEAVEAEASSDQPSEAGSGEAERATRSDEPERAAGAHGSEPEAAEAAPAEPAARETPAPTPAPPQPPSGAIQPEPMRRQPPGALALLKLEKVDDDDSFRLREEGDIDSLATSLARLGQLFPVDLRLRPPDRFQVITGFRRVAALKLLKRERIFARVHTNLSDEEAAMLALADAVEHRAVSREELEVAREKLGARGLLTPVVKEALDRAITPPDESLAPETTEGEEEVDLDELSRDVVTRIAAVNQDLALIAELWSALEPDMRQTLLEQLGYSSQLVTYLEGLK